MTHHKKPTRAVLYAAALVLALAPPAFAQRGGGGYRDIPPSRADAHFLGAFRPATAAASRSTVRVLCDGKEAALGTVVGPDGWVLTKYSLLSGKLSCALKDGRTLEAKVVGVHEAFDLGMLKVEATELPAVTFTESKAAPVGSWRVWVGAGEDPVGVGVMSVASRSPPPARGRGRGPGPLPTNPDYLGVFVRAEGGGAKVGRVFPQSAAAKAGLKAD